MIKKWTIFSRLLLLVLSSSLFAQNTSPDFLSWDELPPVPPAPTETIQPGVAGPFTGISNDALIIAGGANFPEPRWQSDKKYHKCIYVLERNKSSSETDDPQNLSTGYQWITDFELDFSLAYGSSVSSDLGLVCLGGRDESRVFDQVFILDWNPQTRSIKQLYLPNLPDANVHGSAAIIGSTIYLAGGQTGLGLESAGRTFWALDLAGYPDYEQMPDQQLSVIARRRGISMADQSGGSVSGESVTRTQLIQKLLLSDSLASGFSQMSYTELIEIAHHYGVHADSASTRQAILQKLKTKHWGAFNWQKLPAWPGPERAFNITVAQHNGQNDCIYVLSGRRYQPASVADGTFEFDFLNDVYEFDPAVFDRSKKDSNQKGKENPWRRKKDSPACVMAGTAIDVGQSHIFVLGGADGSLVAKANELKDNHPGFPKQSYAYHTITDSWIQAGSIPANHVTTFAISWDGEIIIPSGEIRPRTRSPKILRARIVGNEDSFGWINFLTLAVYLLGMVLIGVYFARRNKNTDDYFRGGQRVPWWAAGCSIFATMLSSLTYMSIPAKAFASNWEYLLGYPAILITAALVVYLILPFFRQIDATSAYEYLEKRFNRLVRMIGSSFFTLFQIARMAIVMFLSALALAAITPFTEVQCILLMGLLSVIYSTLGGVEAVIWTDTIQTFVLLGGALLIFVLILFRIDGGITTFFAIASEHQKFHMVNWNWDTLSYTTTAFWVLALGSMGQNLISYTSDQAVVQRYMTTSNEKKAASAIWANGLMAIPAGILFFGLGTALFVFYKLNPAQLDPSFKTDAIMPLFIARELPVGIAGLIVAGIFAAAQSTISTSMNSTATTIVTDFFRPFRILKSDKGYLNLARLMTLLLGLSGTAMALLFASADIKSLIDQFFAVLGLFGGSLGGLFLLGMFTRRAHAWGAVFGAIVGAIVLYLVQQYSATHLYLYALIGISSCFVSGYLFSVLTPGPSKDITGLNVYTIRRETS